MASQPKTTLGPNAAEILSELYRIHPVALQYAVASANRLVRGYHLAERLTETVTEHTSYIRRSLRSTLYLPSLAESLGADPPGEEFEWPKGERVVLPLMSLTRGTSIADLAVSDSTGDSVTVLPRFTTRALSFALLFSPLRTDGVLPAIDIPDSPERVLYRLLGSDRPVGKSAISEAVVNLAVKHATPDFEFQRLLELSTYLGTRFFHWVEMEATPGRFHTFTYSYRSAFTSQRRPARLAAGARRIRRARGPYYLLDVPNASAARSYNLRLEPPDGHYVAEQDFLVQEPEPEESKMTRREHLRRAVTRSGSTSTSFARLCDLEAVKATPDARVYDGVRGMRGYVHMNCVNIDQRLISRRPLKASIRLAERPPGSAGVAAALALVVLALLWLSFWAGKADFAAPHTDAAVVAIGIPGLLALWLQEVIGGGAKSHVTTLTKALLWLSAIGSLSDVGYITWRLLHGGNAPTHWWAILVDTRWPLFGIFVATMAALVLQATRLGRDSVDFRRRLTRGVDNFATMTNTEDGTRAEV